MGAVAILQIRQMLGGGKIWLLLALAAAPLPLAILIEQYGEFGSAEERELVLGIVLYFFYPLAVCLLGSILYGSSLLSAEIEGKTITYLFTRPLPKWRILLSKYGAMASCLALPAAAGVFLAWLILGAPGGAGLLLGLLAGVGLAAFAYTAINLLIGALFSARPLVVGFIHGLVLELALSLVPAVVNSFTVAYYVRSLVARLSGLKLPLELAQAVGDASTTTAVAVPVGISALLVAITAAFVSLRETTVTEQV